MPANPAAREPIARSFVGPTRLLLGDCVFARRARAHDGDAKRRRPCTPADAERAGNARHTCAIAPQRRLGTRVRLQKACAAAAAQTRSCAKSEVGLHVLVHGGIRGSSDVRLTDSGVSCAAGSACRSRSGAAAAAHDVRRTESRTATAVTPWRSRQRRQLGCRAEAGPHQLQREVRRRSALRHTVAATLARRRSPEGVGSTGLCRSPPSYALDR